MTLYSELPHLMQDMSMGVIRISYQDDFDFRLATNQIQLTNLFASLSFSVICHPINRCMSLAGKGVIFPSLVGFKFT